jgi:3-oxoacyl-[acyl-carrier protein] reductase
MPLAGLDLSSGARAGLTAFLAGVAIETMAKKEGLSAEAALAERVSTVPARRVGQPDEFGATCAFLCSAQAGYITGQNILIDGGAFPGAF